MTRSEKWRKEVTHRHRRSRFHRRYGGWNYCGIEDNLVEARGILKVNPDFSRTPSPESPILHLTDCGGRQYGRSLEKHAPVQKINQANMKRIAIYMFYDEAGIVGDYVIHKLRKLREHVETIIVICNGQLMPDSRDKLEEVADTVHVRANEGFDVWAYRDALIDIVGWERLATYDEVLLMNYTFYAPIFPFSEMFEASEKQTCDFWGITAYKGCTPNPFTGQGSLPFHIQSHFIAVRRRLFTSSSFIDYWEQLPPIRSYVDSILSHESKFTQHFANKGFRFFVYSDPDKYKAIHPSFDLIDLLLEDRCPIMKRRPLFHESQYLEQANVELARALETVKRKSDYDPGLIWRDITRVAKPRTLYTNATLLQILPDEGSEAVLRSGIKIAALAHIYYPEMTSEIVQYLTSIPIPFDLYVTTASEAKKADIEARLKALKSKAFKLKKISIVNNRGRDVSALFIGQKDALAGNYDYICTVHSKLTPQNSFGMARHFKEHLFENLLWNRTYVSNLIWCFENEPNAGLIMPPVVHIGYPTLGNAWFGNRQGAEVWAKKLGITVPFDDYTPLAVYGTMYWFRPAALKRLFDYPFSPSDFPPEPSHVDGGLAHVLERLVVYACHQEGFYAKCVLTPKNAAKNYLQLEYKLQKLIGDSHSQQPTPDEGRSSFRYPLGALKYFAKEKLRPHPFVAQLTQSSYRVLKSPYTFAKRLATSRS